MKTVIFDTLGCLRNRALIRTLSTVTFLLLASAMAGCASLDPEPSFQKVAEAVHQRSGQSISWTVDETDRMAALDALRQPLTLENAVRVALLNSPALQAEYTRLGIAQAEFVQAGLMRNPVFAASYRDGRFEDTLDLGLSIDFLDVFLIPVRKRQAAAGQKAAELSVTEAVMDRVGQVRQSWIAAVAARQSAANIRENQKLLESIDGISEAMLKAGNITLLERQRSRQIMAENQMLLDEAEFAAANAKDALAVVMGAWGGPDWALPSALPEMPESETSIATVENEAVDRSLELEIARERITRAAAGLDLVDRSRLVPTLEVGWVAEREDDLWSNGPALAFALPILDTGRAVSSMQLHRLEKLRREYLQLEIEIRAAARRVQRADALRRANVRYLNEVVLPLSEERIRETRLHYNAALIGIAEVVQARLDQSRDYSTYVQALARYWSARESQLALLQGVRLADEREFIAVSKPESESEMGGH